MTIHWRQMNADAKIEAIKTVWHKGISASQIAAHFEGVTRNAVIGVYNRYRDKLADAPLEGVGRRAPGTSKRDRRPLPWEKPVKVKATLWPAFPKRLTLPGTPRGKVKTSAALPSPRMYAEEQQLVGRPLMMLAACECKWPLTDVAKGAGAAHLFCALPADGPYCAHHAMRSVAERRA